MCGNASGQIGLGPRARFCFQVCLRNRLPATLLLSLAVTGANYLESTAVQPLTQPLSSMSLDCTDSQCVEDVQFNDTLAHIEPKG